jgi:hypothetical protein
MVAVARRCTLLVNGPVVAYRNGLACYVYIPTIGTPSHSPDPPLRSRPPRFPISPRWLRRSTFAMATGRSGRIGASQASGASRRRGTIEGSSSGGGRRCRIEGSSHGAQAVGGEPSMVAAATEDGGGATTPPRSCAMHAGDSSLLHRRDPQPRCPPVATVATLPRQSPDIHRRDLLVVRRAASRSGTIG